jgi:hypothetical protein
VHGAKRDAVRKDLGSAGLTGETSALPDVALQVVTPTDPIASDEYLGRGLDIVLRLECIHFGPRTEHAVIYRKAVPLKQLLGPNPEWARVVREYHPVQGRAAMFGHGLSFG